MGLIYAALLVYALIRLADWLAPYHSLSAEGCTLGYVYDGDTVELLCGGESRTARLVGFDTPETRDPRCAKEAAAGKRATERLRALVRRGVVQVDGLGRDKYGRLLARLFVDGRDVAGVMVAEGLAVEYRGGSRIDWCARLG